MPSTKNIEMAIAGLHAVKLAYETYASSPPAQTIITEVCKALEPYGQTGKYLAEGIRQDNGPPGEHRPPRGA